MRTKFNLLVIAVFFFVCAKAQDCGSNIAKVNPLGAFFGSAQLAYEKAFNEKNSILVAPSFGFFKSGGFKYTTLGIGGEYRFYFKQDAPQGFYAGPGAGVTFGTVKIEDFTGQGDESKTNITGFSVKGIAGYQWILNGGFVLDLNAGIQYLNLKFKDDDGAFAVGAFSGILPALGFSVGYNF